MRFTVLDLETANPQMHSICQLGMVVFEGEREIASNVALIDPQQHFDSFNVGIHGIDEAKVRGERIFAQVHEQMARMLRDQVVISHTHFDRVALNQACTYHGVEALGCRWLDSALIARRAWPRFAQRGFGLANLAREFGIDLDHHHDALEDARATGQVVVRAIAETGIDLEAWFERTKRPAGWSSEARSALHRTGDGDGPLVGECIVFTGTFADGSKGELADMAHVAGAAVEPGVNKRTTMVVVGTQDWTRVGPSGKSGKHLRAEQLIAEGMPILIVTEDDFRELARGPGGLE